jgi:hypothetical protein
LVLSIALTVLACGDCVFGGARSASQQRINRPPRRFPRLNLSRRLCQTLAVGIRISPTSQPAIPERRRITLEFPPQMRAGDSDIVRLTLEVDDLGNVTPTAEVGGNVVIGETVEIPNLYETHNVIAEARFDIAGMQVSPPGLTSQPLAQGAVRFILLEHSP